jgi:hypothetical protein
MQDWNGIKSNAFPKIVIDPSAVIEVSVRAHILHITTLTTLINMTP